MLNSIRQIEPAGNQVDLEQPFPEVFHKTSDGHEYGNVATILRVYGNGSRITDEDVDAIFERMKKRGVVKGDD